jgi:uncharacterized alpha-E superfamily protein
MLSRVAETIYWIGRYQERAENTARLIKVNTNLTLDLPKGIIPDWEPLITILGCDELYHQAHSELTERRIVNFLISDENNPVSILSSLALLRENARTIREILPREGWEHINAMYQRAAENKSLSYARKGRHEYLDLIMLSLQQLTGLLAGSMNHDLAYDFLNLGRKLERADMTTRIIDVRAENTIPDDVPELKPFEDMLWMSMLRSLTAYQMYRQSKQARIQRNDVLNFLFSHATFPRAVSFCVENMSMYLEDLPNNTGCKKHISKLQKVLEPSKRKDMNNIELHEYIDSIQLHLANLHNEISVAYFPQVN